MILFVRARYYYNYAESLLKEVLRGERALTPRLAQDIFTLGLKALYALEVFAPKEEKPTLDEIIKKVLPNLHQSLTELIKDLSAELEASSSDKFSAEPPLVLGKLVDFLKLVKEELKPLLESQGF